MTPTSHTLQSKILSRAKSDHDFAVYRAALEWSLADPIVIESRDDLKSEFRWKDRFDPFHHQVENLITFCRRLPVTLLADDVGLGKTISAGLIASELIARSRVSRILIVAPKILGHQWKEELETKFDISTKVATGRELLKAEPTDVGAVITTYQSARTYLEQVPEDRFDMLVLDEAHKLRNLYGVDSPPQVAKVFHRALQDRRFPYVLMLTATPIQNRLWDLYSLVELLAVARGHENPFGSEGMFARRFIGDKREAARVLKPGSREEFRKIVYGYMSRVRRGDTKLTFPERKIQLHKVTPSDAELALINAIAEPIQGLNRLSQISILQALASSPHALMEQLNTMAANGTVPKTLAAIVRSTVEPMGTSAKLEGLGQLVSHLEHANPTDWRLIVFTTRIETQTSIQDHLEKLGLKVGIINGASGQRNQETLRCFRANPPEIRAIVSTEAGSEGINLQIANVLINFDLPWNPMTVEHRIGRVQRLGSNHKHVVIYNVMLAGTFEEYIVGRLISKLQMATDAIGEMESLLEAAGVGAENDDGESMGEKIRALIVAALAGVDTTAAAEQISQSIDAAKTTLETEKENIDATLGRMEGYEYVGPRAPTLSPPQRSMGFEPFLRSAFALLGGTVTEVDAGTWRVATRQGEEFARLTSASSPEYANAPLYAPGSPPFLRLIDRLTISGLHSVLDSAPDARSVAEKLAQDWVRSFDAEKVQSKITSIQRRFDGSATVRVRAVTAHDSYERLIEVPCDPEEHTSDATADGLSEISDLLQGPADVGVVTARLVDAARRDENISEFERFYLERRTQELSAAAGDPRKTKKLEDEFTPRIETTVVALRGLVERNLTLRVHYKIDGADYESDLRVKPGDKRISASTPMERCELSGRRVPAECLAACDVTGARALKHQLVQSQLSGRFALPAYAVTCSASGQLLLDDEVGLSEITNRKVDRRLLVRCAITGNLSEPAFRGVCTFTGADVLKDHLAKSSVSKKLYRSDEMLHCVVTGKAGHKSEFIRCHETQAPLLESSAERCAVSGHQVRPDILQACEETGKRVLPSELARSSVSGKNVLRSMLVQSSLSDARFLPAEGIRDTFGIYCTPKEARRCAWSGVAAHPDDIRKCSLLGLPVLFQYLSEDAGYLQALEDLLSGIAHTDDRRDVWSEVRAKVASAANVTNCSLQSSTLSPDGKTIAFLRQDEVVHGTSNALSRRSLCP